MLPSRPLHWAKGTDFDPYFDDANHIAIQVDISDEDDKERYNSCIQWIHGNIPGEVTKISSDDAAALWKFLSE
jgi:hypothetical protein